MKQTKMPRQHPACPYRHHRASLPKIGDRPDIRFGMLCVVVTAMIFGFGLWGAYQWGLGS